MKCEHTASIYFVRIGLRKSNNCQSKWTNSQIYSCWKTKKTLLGVGNKLHLHNIISNILFINLRTVSRGTDFEIVETQRTWNQIKCFHLIEILLTKKIFLYNEILFQLSERNCFILKFRTLASDHHFIICHVLWGISLGRLVINYL